MNVLDYLAYTLFAVGALMCGLNFYLSFLRYPLCKLLGREYKWSSGIPLFGSLLLIIAVTLLRDSPVLFWSGLAVAMLDTGDLHWFMGGMLWRTCFDEMICNPANSPSLALRAVID
ncbi:MAG: hypothetical protein SH850_11665 [Planctomycetaceae bacterium]|nr:hypothetical protein [Planctomycetaceae bacterium]